MVEENLSLANVDLRTELLADVLMSAPAEQQPLHSSPYRILHVEDDLQFASLTAELIEKESDLEVVTESGPSDALKRLETETGIDCILSDYQMPNQNGLGFLDSVRESYPHLPFVLFTNHDAKQLIDKAVSVGVTDYITKDILHDRRAVFINRLKSFSAGYRYCHTSIKHAKQLKTLFESTTDCVGYCIPEGEEILVEEVNSAFERTFGVREREIAGEPLSTVLHSTDDTLSISDCYQRGSQNRIETPYCQYETANGARSFSRGIASIGTKLNDTALYVILSEQRGDTADGEVPPPQMNAFQQIIHDLHSPLNVAQANFELYRKSKKEEFYERAEQGLDRAESIAKEGLTLAENSVSISDHVEKSVRVDTVAEDAWNALEQRSATLDTTETVVEADKNRLQRLLENTLQNAVEHGGDDVTVRVGPLRTESGFFIEDDGNGISTSDTAQLFQAGYSTRTAGSGFGLTIVRHVADTHDWRLRIIESEDGGFRLEVVTRGGST